MADARPIGRWNLTALVINCIIGSAIFGVPAEAIRLLGYRSPLGMAAAAVLMGLIILPISEVASQFSEPGGMYLYARTAFGSFAGLQVGWFWMLAVVGGGAANANLFVTYLAQFFPAAEHGWLRAAIILFLIAVPAAANYRGVRQGAELSAVFTVAKVVPLLAIIVLGLVGAQAAPASSPQLLHPATSWGAWSQLLLILLYSFSGWEDALVPAGEVKDPRRSVPFALMTGLLFCAVIYTLFQYVIVLHIGPVLTNRPVVTVASSLLGNAAGSFVALAVMLSTYGWISGALLNAARWPVALAREGDAPAFLGRLHPRFGTPVAGLVVYAGAVLLLALTGTFLWAIELTAGALTIFYAVTCGALLRLRHLQPNAPAFRLRFGPAFAILGITIAIALLTQLELRQLALMSVTLLLGAANWFWAKRALSQPRPVVEQTPV